MQQVIKVNQGSFWGLVGEIGGQSNVNINQGLSNVSKIKQIMPT